eukprot:g47725.t1
MDVGYGHLCHWHPFHRFATAIRLHPAKAVVILILTCEISASSVCGPHKCAARFSLPMTSSPNPYSFLLPYKLTLNTVTIPVDSFMIKTVSHVLPTIWACVSSLACLSVYRRAGRHDWQR